MSSEGSLLKYAKNCDFTLHVVVIFGHSYRQNPKNSLRKVKKKRYVIYVIFSKKVMLPFWHFIAWLGCSFL